MPELVLILVLPPIIYSAGVSMSWREFKFNLRPIALLAIGCVVFTTCAVAVSLHGLLGWPWAVAFVLGAIVAPPDVVAPLAIARRLGLPRRLRVILEGEGLANDATALVLYRFAVVAVSTGAFSFVRRHGEVRVDPRGRARLWDRSRLAHAAPAPRRGRCARRDPAVAAHALRRVLASGVPRRLGRARDRGGRALRQLEWTAADLGRHAAAGHLLLGFLPLHHRGPALPSHGPAGAHNSGRRKRLSLCATS